MSSTAGTSSRRPGCKALLIAILLLLLLLWLLSQCRGGGEPGSDGKVVFVTSELFTGNFGAGQRTLGHLDADAECTRLATAAGLSGSFKAWLSGRVDTGAGPLPHGVVDRFVQSSEPYVLVNGTKVADDWADLTDATLDHAIDVTETGGAVGNVVRVWSNTTTGGLAWDNSTHCAEGPSTDIPTLSTWSCGAPSWTAGDCAFQAGKFGDATSVGASWTGAGASNDSCDGQYHLYCFEQ